MPGLHITERPNKLKDVIGNKGAIECIRGFMNRAKEDIPQTWLIQGPPGCGKTTLARIVRNELGVRDLNFHEYNSANMRGIDTIREISRNAASSPLGGGEQAYLIDECFHPDTLIDTPNGKVKIKDIQIGDKVLNIFGIDTVVSTKKNKVSLDRLCMVTLSNGKKVFTTTDHKFFTSKGWVPAKNLENASCVRYVNSCERNHELNSEERQNPKTVRVESVTLYEQANFQTPFKNKITDEERHKGFVEFYDLQVHKHPSYKAEGVIVHNCHQLTGAAQESFLKILEDVPKNTWFFLATTNPEKLRPAIKSRSTIISVTRVNNKEAKNLIERTLKNLGLKSIPVTVQKQIIQHANGACRDILKLLDTVIDISDENDMLDAVNTAYANASTVKELWTALLDKKEAKLKWKKVSAILKNIDEEPEQVRQAMLTVLSNNLLDTGSVKTLGMIEAFEDAYHSTGKAGLVMSCFNACYI